MYPFTLSLSLLALTVTAATAQTADSLNRTVQDTTTTLSHRTLLVPQNKQAPLERKPVSVFTRTLDGLIPGLQSTNGGGQPGAAPELLIRGIGSITAISDPLLVVNGTVYSGNVSSLNLQDIASITVHKDAAATVLYGNRSANGVIEIVTKEEVDGHNRLSVDIKTGIVTRGIRDYDKLSTKDYYETLYSAAYGGYWPINELLNGYNAFDIPNNEIFTPEGKVNPDASLLYDDDWVKETQRIGFKQDYNIATSGAGRKGNYYIAGGYLSEKGYIKSTGFERGNVSFNGAVKMTSWLKAGLWTTGATGSQHIIPLGTSKDNPFYAARLMPSMFPVYYRNPANGAKETDPLTGQDKYDWGSLMSYPSSSISERFFAPASNVAGSLALDDRNNKFSTYIATPYLEVRFLKQFTLSTHFNYNYNEDRNYTYRNYSFTRKYESTTLAKLRVYSWDQVLNWELRLKKHHIKATLGHDTYQQKYSELSKAFSNGVSTGSSSNIFYHVLRGYYIKGEYAFKEKLFFNGGLRADETSNLAPNWRKATYWGAAAGYDISKEYFLKHKTWINELKLRVSYGIQGNSGLPKDAIYGEIFGHFDAGIDIALFNNRLALTADYYNRKATSPSGVPPVNPYFDIIRIENTGLELELQGIIIQKRDLQWSTRLLATHNRNRMLFPNSLPFLFAPPYQMKTGSSVYDFYLPGYAGVDPSDGQALYYHTMNNGNTIAITDYGMLQSSDYKKSGSALPLLYGAISNTCAYKQFEFSFQLCYSLGGRYYDRVYADLMGNGREGGTWSPDILNHWTPQNTQTDIPRVTLNDIYGNATSDRFLRNASYLNIKNVYLGYNVATPRLKKTRLQTLTLYLTAENLWLFAAHKAIDPQASFNGMGGYNYLPARTIMVGIHAGL